MTELAPAPQDAPVSSADVLVLRRLPGAKLESPAIVRHYVTCAVVLPGRTALEALAASLRGDERPEPGAIEVLGADLARMPRVPRPGSAPTLGWVPQDGGLLSNLNVWENIALPVTYHWPRVAGELPSLVNSIMERLGLDAREICGRRPVDLSVLERRLVSFVRAVAMVPELLVLDATLDDLEGEVFDRAKRMFEVFAHALPFRHLVHLGTRHMDHARFGEPAPIIVEVQ